MFVVLDGIDGCGSTTHSRMLAGFLESEKKKVHVTKEPSSFETGSLLRKFLKDNNIPPTTDALMFAADRSLHYYNEIKKKLDEGYIVISDRYKESSLVYQLLQSDEISIDWVKEINKHAGTPDITIILDVDPRVSLARKSGEDLEKFENVEFLDKVRALFLERAKQEGYFVINSDDIIELVQEEIKKIVINKLK